jgi:hypothetical protein
MVRPTLLFLVFAGLWPAVASGKPVGFNEDIRPLLSDRCFHCHGPDAKTRKAGLRLDTFDGATADLGGFAAVVPGDPERSLLLERVSPHAGEDRMPPARTKKPFLTPAEIDRLREWIVQGAKYEAHWAFLPLRRPVVPEVPGRAGAHPVDRFVAARLRDAGFDLAPEADPRTLARRLFLDLTGLLPDPAEVDAFVAAHAEDADAAVEDLADRLLESPHHAERWARHWLDQARYADSNGYTIDGERSQWPWRDWVIRAIRDDLPFDRFTVEQLAGDLLPDPRKEQLVATGFHRNTLINQEGGTDDEQFRNEAVVDRVNTTGAVWLGLTLGCAQCHSHKFDPISQTEYYRLFAFFNQGDDVNHTGSTVEVSEGELLLRDADPALLANWETAKKRAADLDRNRSRRQQAWERAALAPSSSSATPVAWQPLRPEAMTSTDGAVLARLPDDSVLAARGGPRETYTVRWSAPGNPVAAIRLRVLLHESLPAQGPGLAGNGNFVLTGVTVRHGGRPVALASAQADHEQPGFPAAGLIDGDPQTAWAINVGPGSAPGVRMNAPHEAHLVPAVPIPADGRPLEVVLHHELNDGYNVGRFAVDVASVVPPALATERLRDALATKPEDRTEEQKKLLAGEFDRADMERRQAEAELTAARQALGFGESAKSMVMRDLPEPRETFLQVRGDFLRPDRELGPLRPGVPAVFPGLVDDPARPNRLDLARWMVRPDHPLTPRVTVNRVWMRYFGKGLVETENDFGTQGSLPTHPDLLDWLASSFVDQGWSMRKLHRLIVTSRVYRQASVTRPELASVDPLNRMLGRQNRLRVEAEIVRDAALSASGLLEPKVGGPSVMPPQPEGVYAFTQRKVSWVAATGPDRFRRALYTRFYRSAPYPLLTAFDSPDFQSVCTARTRSNTPLQALMTANDEAMFELARGLGHRLLREVPGSGDEADRKRLEHGWRLTVGRSPTPAESKAVADYRRSQEASFLADPAAARQVAGSEELADATSAARVASWTAVARALLNTDEFITRE